MIEKIKIISKVLMLLLLCNSCINDKSKITPIVKKKELEKKDTLEYIYSVELERTQGASGTSKGILAENDSMFYISEIFDSNRNIYLNGKLIIDTISTFEDIKNKYHLKKIDYKKFIKSNNYYDKLGNCGITNTKESNDTIKNQISILKSKNGNIYKYSDIQGKPYKLMICTKDKKYDFNLRVQLLREDLDKYNGYIGFGITTAKLYDIDKDGKEELLIINKTYDGAIIIYIYKINFIE